MKRPGALIALLVSATLGACGDGEPAAEAGVVESFMADPQAVARGEALFIGSCVNYCHQITPTANDAAFLFDCEWDHGNSDEAIFNVIARGVPGTRMVGFGGNFPDSEDDLWKVIAYIRSNQQPCG